MAVKCIGCGKYLSTTAPDGVTCSKCKNTCHKVCVGIASGAQISKSWWCPDCIARLPKGSNPSTPVARESTSSALDRAATAKCATPELQKEGANVVVNLSSGSEVSPSQWKQEIFEQMERLCNSLKLDFCSKLDEVKLEFQAFRQEMVDVRGEVASCVKHITELEDRIAVLEGSAKVAEDPEVTKSIQELETTVSQLKLDLNDRDQELLLNDLDFTGITEESGENATHVVISCAAKLGVTLEERDIVSCMRLGAANTAVAGVSPRPRPIALRLARRAVRDTILKAARVRRGSTTEGIGARSKPQPFYVNERLTKHNRTVFNRARKVRTTANWRYVWTQNGKVFVRQSQGTPRYLIRSETDLIRVFGVDAVRSADAGS